MSAESDPALAVESRLLRRSAELTGFPLLGAEAWPEAVALPELREVAAQMPAEKKAARADFVIRTDGTSEETDAQVEEIWRNLKM